MEKGEIILYQPDNSVQLEVRVEHETIWLTQAQIALIYKSNELDASSTCAKNAQVQKEGARTSHQNGEATDHPD